MAGGKQGVGESRSDFEFRLAGTPRACQTFCNRKSGQGHGGQREEMGRPPGEPTKVVRLPLPLAALAKRLEDKSLRAGDINAFIDVETDGPLRCR